MSKAQPPLLSQHAKLHTLNQKPSTLCNPETLNPKSHVSSGLNAGFTSRRGSRRARDVGRRAAGAAGLVADVGASRVQDFGDEG